MVLAVFVPGIVKEPEPLFEPLRVARLAEDEGDVLAYTVQFGRSDVMFMYRVVYTSPPTTIYPDMLYPGCVIVMLRAEEVE